MTIDGGYNQYVDQNGRYTGPERRLNWPPETIMKTDQHWSLDRRVNITVIIALVMMAISSVSFGISLRQTVDRLVEDNKTNHASIAELRNTHQAFRDLVARMDSRQAAMDVRQAGTEKALDALVRTNERMVEDISRIRAMMEQTRREREGGPR